MQFMALVQCKGVGLGQGFPGSMLVCSGASCWFPHGRCSTQHYEKCESRGGLVNCRKVDPHTEHGASFELQQMDPGSRIHARLRKFGSLPGQDWAERSRGRVVSLEAALELATALTGDI